MRARAGLHNLATELRDEVATVEDPRTRSLFATTADLLTAVEEAFANAQTRDELGTEPDLAVLR